MTTQHLEYKLEKHNCLDLKYCDTKGTLTVEEYLWNYELFEGTCFYCGKKHPNSLDHKKPRSKGGITAIWNVIICCCKCNEQKSSKLFEDFVIEKNVSDEKLELAQGVANLENYTGEYSLIELE